MANFLKANFKYLVLILILSACGEVRFKSSNSSGSADLPTDKTVSPFSCVAGAKPTNGFTRRLNKNEYLNTLEVITARLSAADKSALDLRLKPALDLIPADSGYGFKRADNTVTQEHISGFTNAAQTIGLFIGENTERVQRFVGTCAQINTLTDACFETLFSGLGKLIYRRPLKDSEKQTLKTQYNAYVSNKTGWIIARMLSSPNFFMHLETEGKPISSDVVEISQHELANRIAYHLTETMPDSALMAAADAGSLKDPELLRSQVERLINTHPNARKVMKNFYREWLDLNDGVPLGNPNVDPVYNSFAQGQFLSPSAVIQEIEDMTSYYTFDTDGTFRDLILSDVSFAKTDELAAIYGVKKWSGDLNDLVRFPARERAGLLTRSALLVADTAHTNPVMRGVRMREKILCDHLPPPPPEIVDLLRVPEIDPKLSTRERFEQKTNGTACIGCHAQINPIGFALEAYDALGRHRSKEKIYDSQGQFLSEVEVDDDVVPGLSPSEQAPSSDPVEFSELVVRNGKAENCFVQKYYHFVHRKVADLATDGCSLEAIRSGLVGSQGSLKSMIINSILDPAFRQKRL